MKREEIKLDPHNKNIVLGVFSTNEFNWCCENLPVYRFGRFCEWAPEVQKSDNNILDFVEYAAKIAEKIVFVLDDLHFPINPEASYTCGELQIICNNEELFNKTIFVKGENVITFDKNLVL